jgi:hypothetical protein
MGKPKYTQFSTFELIEFAKQMLGYAVECKHRASVIVGPIVFTYFIYWDKDCKQLHVEQDGHERWVTPERFCWEYAHTTWSVDVDDVKENNTNLIDDDPKQYVCFTVNAGCVNDLAFKLMTFDNAIKKALKIVKKHLGKTFSPDDTKEILQNAKQDLRDRRFWTDENELDIYIRYIKL